MAMTANAPTEAIPESAKRPGDEPLPGYRLISPLGRGGFGEVWKCEAPGGLQKAIKFVPSDEANHSLRQEFEAFQAIKAIRHPFLLQLERVELTQQELIMVMELADSQLQERFLECRNAGLPGIPKDELLSYLADAAEALDVISVRHGLQHLDVKPANLFLVCGRVKVGDYGLVRAESTSSTLSSRGFTPRYVAPEVLKGRVDNRSDQYSLALVYQELLTGTFAYTARTAQQMMMAHASAAPDLSSLPEEDIAPMAIALAKQPEERYSTCLAFVEALMMGGINAPRHDTFKPNDTATVTAMQMRRVQSASGFLSRPNLTTPGPARARTLPGSGSISSVPPAYGAPPPQFVMPLPGVPQPPQFGTPAPAPAARQSASLGSRAFSAPPLTSPRAGLQSFSAPPAQFGRSGSTPHASIVPEEPVDLVVSGAARKVQLSDAMLKSVLPTTVLTGRTMVPASVTGDWFVNTLMAAAIGETDHLGRTPAGTWIFRFRSVHPISVARHKIEAMKSDEWFDEITDRDSTHILLRRYASAGLFGRFGGKKAGLELEVAWPTGRGGEVDLTAKLFGEPDMKFSRGMAEAMPRIFNEIRSLLKAGDERRKDPRIPSKFALTLYPLKDDGEVLAPIPARCRDLSAGGLCLTAQLPLPTRYVYVEFSDISGIAGLGLLTKMIRSQPNGSEHLFAGRFRVDL